MRLVGVMLVVLTGTALASDVRLGVGLFRFGYADAFARELGAERAPTSTRRERRAGESRRSTQRPAALVTPERMLDDLIATAVAPFIPPAARKQSRPRTIARAPRKRIETIAPLPAGEVLRSPEPVPQRLSALTEPMHLLSPTEIRVIEEPVPRKVHRIEKRSPRRTAKKSRAARGGAKSFAKKIAVNRPKVPRWAEKMFDNVWQDRAFAYQ